MKRLLTHGAVLLGILAFSLSAFAQVEGRLVGTVVDPTGAAVPGATVNLMLPGGDRPILTVTTSAEGFFTFNNVRPELYDLTVEGAGFGKQVVRGVKVDPARDTAVGAIRLEVRGVTAEVAVIEGVSSVQTSSAEVSSTITNAQLQQLPMIDRSPLALIATQAGVTNGRGPTVINGLRTSMANVTMDGINIQDNLFRENGLDFNPNLLLNDQVAEVSISTSNAASTLGGGAAHVAFVTPSGGNQYHGSLYWANRNNALAANDWFSNRDGIPNPFLNQNQFGGKLSGPVFKDKLLFYGNYEGFRHVEQAPQLRRILTDSARNGIFTYGTASNPIKVNLLQLAGVQADPAIQKILALVPGADKINTFDTGDSTAAFLKNTAGYTFVQQSNRNRDNASGKLDYHASTKHAFTGSVLWNRDILDRPDVNTLGYTTKPKVANDDTINLMSVGWRWNPSGTFTNEVRGGFNIAPALFATTETFDSPYLLSPAGTVFSNPVNTFRAQGRDTNTYTILDNASYSKGKHNVQFGFQYQAIRTAPFNDAGITPTYTLGIGAGNTGLIAAQLPGISAADLTTANNLLSTLAGYVTSYTQTFNITDRNSKFVNGATNRRHFTLDHYGYYGQDSWKVSRRLTATLGLRYDYYTTVDERDGLVLLPQMNNNDYIGALLSNSTLDFAGGSTGKPFYGKDRNNFAPNLGFAYDVFGDGKTAIRAGYSFSYVDDQTIAAVRNNVVTSSGLSSTSTATNLSGRVSASLPPVIVPTYKVPRTFADNYAIDTQSAFGLPDPNLRTPYVQSWSFGIQHEIKGTVLEARYVANHGVKEYRAFDYNQAVIKENGFLDDFKRAQSNGNLAVAAGRGFDPSYNPAIAGSQQLPIFNQLSSQGLLTNTTIRSLIQTGEPGELAFQYQASRLNGAINFFRNPFALGTNTISNYSNSTYNSLQTEVRRRLTQNLQFQASYSFSKVLSDSSGDLQTRFEPFLDNANPAIERSRPTFDVTHAFKANSVYEMPFGQGHRWNVSDGGLSKLISGWRVSGILTWQSGGPFSLLSARGTVNRASRSTSNTADATANFGQLQDIVKLRMSPTGPYIIAASAIGTDGRGVAADGSAPFSGQVFFNPTAGSNGSLQRRVFTGPSVSNLDMALSKTTKFRESQSIEIRAEASNVLNHPSFYVNADPNVNSTTFGKITTTFFDRRLVTFSLYYRF